MPGTSATSAKRSSLAVAVAACVNNYRSDNSVAACKQCLFTADSDARQNTFSSLNVSVFDLQA